MANTHSAALMVHGGPDDGVVVELNEGMTTIGRGLLNDIVIDRPGVSRAHAGILVDDQGVWIADLGSRNGTYVNDERIGTDPKRLGDQDLVELGGIEEAGWIIKVMPQTAEGRARREAVPSPHRRVVQVVNHLSPTRGI